MGAQLSVQGWFTKEGPGFSGACIGYVKQWHWHWQECQSKLEVYTSASELGEVKLEREVSTGKAGTHTLATSASGMYASELEV